MSDATNTTHHKNRKKHVKDNIKVAVRCRPLLSGERSLCEIVSNTRKKQIGIVIPRARGRDSNKLYTFDTIYDACTDQHKLFTSSIDPIITDVLSGYNCTVFAYGQTGSGKTYTMEGTRFETHSLSKSFDDLSDTDGIIPRAINSIFSQLERAQIESTVIVSHLEIYNEELTDLLCDLDIKKKKLAIYNDTKKSKGNCVFVQGLEEIIVSSPQHIFDILSKSMNKRRTAATNLNLRSSRSHCIFTVTIRIKTLINTEEIVKTGTLNLVDLAGSESIARSGADKINERAKEAGHINTSLLTLGRVISALVERRQHIPYRESKLTRLLQESLGGRNKTLLIATISQCSPLEQTLSTLDYALRAKNIQNKPQLNVSMTKEKYVRELQVLINNYKKQIEALRNEKGIILPPLQYENMNKKLESQQGEIERINALFECEKQKLLEMNELFTRTNDALKGSLEEKETLIGELTAVSLSLESVTCEVQRQRFVIGKYQTTEERLRTQAENVKNVLENCLSDNHVLYEKMDRRQSIESGNVSEWGQKRDCIMGKLVFMANELKCFRDKSDAHMSESLGCVSDVSASVGNVLQSVRDMRRFNNGIHCAQMQERQGLRQEFIVRNLCDTQLKEYLSLCQGNNASAMGKCTEISDNILPNFISDISEKMSGLQSKLTDLNNNLQKMYTKQRNDRDLFVANLQNCMALMCEGMTDYENKSNQYLSEWKAVHSNLIHECKQNALNEMSKVFDEISNKQMTFFNTKYNDFMQMKRAQNKTVNECNISQMQSVINKYETNENSHCKSNEMYRTHLINNLKENTLQKNIVNSTINEWNSKMESNMNNLSQIIGNGHKSQNNYIQKNIINDLNIFNNKCNGFDTQLMHGINTQNNNFINTEKELNKNISSLRNYINETNAHNTRENKPYLTKLCTDINNVKSECAKYEINKYAKTGQTPTKHNVIYPTKFIETESFEHLISEFNAQNSGSTHASSLTKSGRTKSHSVTPFFMCDEIEINFTETELGFRMYCGERNKNCFVRHCHSDPRVCDNAQIIGIDGIDVSHKSVGYIRTLLATKQRPIAIKFKNVSVNSMSQSAGIHTTHASDTESISSSNVSMCHVNTRKRQRENIVKPKIHKLHYSTPSRKRHKKNRIVLSPISNVMDIDSKTDID